MRPGVRVGVDVGSVRVGVAASDASGQLASPVEVLPRDLRRQSDVQRLAAIVAERDAVEVVVGLPLSMDGVERAAARAGRDYATSVAARVRPVPVRLVDERLSTVEAQRRLTGAGRTTKNSRGVIDAAAAVVLLQATLDRERATGDPGGVLVELA